MLITGASAGIGRATAEKLAAAGAHVLLVARTAEKLDDVRREIERAGGVAHVFTADLADLESCDALVKEVTSTLGGVDVLVNNAGRSIRRSILLSQDRFHDYQRTMQLNYFGALRLVFGFLPSMREQRHGHVVNVSSIGVQTNPPRFSAYVASKAALDAFSRVAASELRRGRGAPHHRLHAAGADRDDRADLDLQGLPHALGPAGGRAGVRGDRGPAQARGDAARRGGRDRLRRGARGLRPRARQAYRLFPDSAAARGRKDARPAEEPELSSRAVAFAHLVPGVHW